MCVFSNKLKVCLHEIHILRALLSIYVQFLEELMSPFGCFISTSNSASKKFKSSYFPSTLPRFPILAYGLPIYPDASARTLEEVLEFSRETFFSFFITHVIFTWYPRPRIPSIFHTCVLPRTIFMAPCCQSLPYFGLHQSLNLLVVLAYSLHPAPFLPP